MTYYSTDFKAFPKWQRVLPSLQGDGMGKYNHNYVPTFEDLNKVNQQYNAYKYTAKDLDTWQTPAETLKSKSGDCADLSIAKLQALRSAGVPDDAMRIVVGKIRDSAQIHAVLMVNHEGKDLILDNFSPEIKDRDFYTKPRDKLPEGYMQFLYGINPRGWDRY